MLKKIIKIIFPSVVINQLRNYYWPNHVRKLTDNIYYSSLKKRINWENPKDLNEKIHWLKLYSDTSRWPDLTDKYKVRQYVTNCGLGMLLNELYAKYDSVDEIDIDKLPDSFVIRQNNACGDTLIIEDKSKVTNREIKKYFREKQKKHYGVMTAEPHYLRIKSCIIAEKILKNTSLFSSSLIDYKFLCFNGQAKYILVCTDRQGSHCKFFTYDLDWNFRNSCLPLIPGTFPKPQSLTTMIKASEILSKGFPFVRVDFYETDGVPVFGEMTFTPAAGFIDYFTPDFLEELGSYIPID
ncbi:MAG: hypothetical protein LBG15_06465 [Dysgonamonadaceae bacterium]|nr:hypothetical protein [Dysgonamonadaceae bacterium]